MSLDPAMAALAARTAAAWRAEQDAPCQACDGDGIARDEDGNMTDATGNGLRFSDCPECQTDALPLVTAQSAHILIPALRELRPELVHFAGAAHRDPAALAVCQEWQLDREASEDVLRERGRARRGGAW